MVRHFCYHISIYRVLLHIVYSCFTWWTRGKQVRCYLGSRGGFTGDSFIGFAPVFGVVYRRN